MENKMDLSKQETEPNKVDTSLSSFTGNTGVLSSINALNQVLQTRNAETQSTINTGKSSHPESNAQIRDQELPNNDEIQYEQISRNFEKLSDDLYAKLKDIGPYGEWGLEGELSKLYEVRDNLWRLGRPDSIPTFDLDQYGQTVDKYQNEITSLISLVDSKIVPLKKLEQKDLETVENLGSNIANYYDYYGDLKDDLDPITAKAIIKIKNKLDNLNSSDETDSLMFDRKDRHDLINKLNTDFNELSGSKNQDTSLNPDTIANPNTETNITKQLTVLDDLIKSLANEESVDPEYISGLNKFADQLSYNEEISSKDLTDFNNLIDSLEAEDDTDPEYIIGLRAISYQISNIPLS